MPGVNPTKTTMEKNKQNTGRVAPPSSDNRCIISDPRDVRQIIAESRSAVVRAARHYNYLYGSHLKKDDIDDVVQDAMCKAIANAMHYDPKKAKVTTWISRIVRNEIVDRLKEQAESMSRSVRYADESDEDGVFDDGIRQLHFRRDEEEGASGHVESAEGRMLSRLRVECISRAVGSLSKRDQRVITMLMQNVPGAVMARRLELTEAAQRKLVHDVRKRLHKELDACRYQSIEGLINVSHIDIRNYEDDEDLSIFSF